MIYFNIIFIKKIDIKTDYLLISKNETLRSVIFNNLENTSDIEKIFYKIHYKLLHALKYKINYGHFYINKKISFNELIFTLSKPSNILRKITIVEGWSHYELEQYLEMTFNDYKQINYNEILADTYFISYHDDFEKFLEIAKKFKDEYFNGISNYGIFERFSEKEIIIIGSLLEKEGQDYNDKRKIYSVIINRLNRNMKLQIDATVIYAITNGNYKFSRSLRYSDLKLIHEFNTYLNKGLPPGAISYVGTKTIDLILENYKTDYLFYFYNNDLKKHIFSINYKNHKRKLNEYRNKK